MRHTIIGILEPVQYIKLGHICNCFVKYCNCIIDRPKQLCIHLIGNLLDLDFDNKIINYKNKLSYRH